MIKELINFTESLDEEFKNLGSSPKEGLHILMKYKTLASGVTSMDTTSYQYEFFSKKQKIEVSDFLNHCKLLHQNAWCIDTNKCFDLPTKAIHTCSPFALAFKQEHLEGGTKFDENQGKKKKQIYDRFNEYFVKAFSLFSNEEEQEKYVIFKNFFAHNEFSAVLKKVEEERAVEFAALSLKIEQLKNSSRMRKIRR